MVDSLADEEMDPVDELGMPVWKDFAVPLQKVNRLKEEARAAKKPSPKALAKGLPPVKRKVKK